MILAAGLGTRLRPLTLTRPKPLMFLRGRPLIHYALDYMVQAGVNQIAINTHYLAEQISDALGDSYQGVPLRYLYEPEILGTGGGLKNACDKTLGYEEPVFLMNSDIAVDLDLKGFLAAHRESDPEATLLLKTVEHPERFGAIGSDAFGQVRTILKHIEYQGPKLLERMFCGVHLISARALKQLPSLHAYSIIDQFYVPLVKSGARVMGFEQLGQYFDLGTFESLEEAERNFT